MQPFVVINPTDNVATATRDLDRGNEYLVEVGDQKNLIYLKADIAFGHKVAVRNIKKGEPVYKYGEKIGVALNDIDIGDIIHTHNLASQRGRGDLA